MDENGMAVRDAMEMHHHFMGLALEEARKAYACSEVPVGAVLVGVQGEILSRAHNAYGAGIQAIKRTLRNVTVKPI